MTPLVSFTFLIISFHVNVPGGWSILQFFSTRAQIGAHFLLAPKAQKNPFCGKEETLKKNKKQKKTKKNNGTLVIVRGKHLYRCKYWLWHKIVS